MSVMATSVAVLNTGLKAVGGETVTYRRGNDSIDGLVAVPVTPGTTSTATSRRR